MDNPTLKHFWLQKALQHAKIDIFYALLAPVFTSKTHKNP